MCVILFNNLYTYQIQYNLIKKIASLMYHLKDDLKKLNISNEVNFILMYFIEYIEYIDQCHAKFCYS